MIKAMHDRHKLNKAMVKFREGLSEMSAVDPENPENPGVQRAIDTLEDKVDYWLEELDRVPVATFTPGPWDARSDGAIEAHDADSVAIYIAENVDKQDAALIAAAPDLAYAAYRLWRRLSADPGMNQRVLDDIVVALRKAGIDVR